MTNIDAVSPAAAAPPARAPCQNPTVDLQVQKNLLTLKHNRANRLRVLIQPESCRATEFRIEIQRASGGGWFRLSTHRNFLWLARVAGRFKLRGVAKIEGSEYQSGPKDVEVRFPSYDEIVGDSNVRDATRQEWALTLRDCTRNPNRRRERGFWIQINTRTNRYFFTQRTRGAWVGPGNGASVPLPARPADQPVNPDPNAPGAKYPVASFHTHTPTTHRAGDPRGVGPSGADNNIDRNDHVPGVVYDYVESPAGSGDIPMGHRKSAAARRYLSLGVTRRPTP